MTTETLPEYRCIHCYRAFTALSGSPVFRLCERCLQRQLEADTFKLA